MKILIVDDNSNDRTVLRYMVREHGHETIEAEDGFTGLRIAKETGPDLIISDALMPVMDGFQFLREAKHDPALQSIPFIFYSSSYKGYQDVRLAVSLGADAYIIKPVDPVELWEQIRNLLDVRNKAETTAVPLIQEDAEYLKRYSEVVATKLEEKVRELERTLEERKRADEALKKSETFIKNILESIDEGFIVIDRDFRILSANRAYIEQFNNGRTTDVTGRYCFELSHRSDKPCFELGEECPSQKAFATGMPHRALHKHADSEGKAVTVETKAYPMKDESGAIVSVIEIVVDISEKTRLEEQLRQAQKMEAIGILAGGVAHDFNNILTAIIGYGNLAKFKMPPDDPQRNFIDQILLSSDRAAHLTQGLLAFSRKQVINPKPADLNAVVKSVEKLLRRLIGEDVEFSVRYTDRDLVAMIDAGQIEQVLMNLATNARDAMPEGGALTVTTEKVDLKEDFISAYGSGSPGAYALITVSDTGHGMDEVTREKLFEPFFTTKEPGKGTGLGLAIVYGIVKQHNGNITVYSDPGKGTTFKIYLPLIAAATAEASAAAPASPRGGSETILLAEDDQAVRDLTKFILQEFGYRVIEAVDGQDAVHKFTAQAGDIDLLLMDVIMPKKNGKEVYDAIRTVRPDMNVLFMSGYTAEILHKKGIFEEEMRFIAKPVNPFELLRTIRDILDSRSGQGRSPSHGPHATT